MFPVPEEVKTGLIPDTAFPFASFRVIVMVALSILSALTGAAEATSVVCTAAGAPATKLTAVPTFETGVSKLSVLDSAFLDLSVQLDAPDESEAEQAE